MKKPILVVFIVSNLVLKNIEASGSNCLLIQPIPHVDYPVHGISSGGILLSGIS